MTAKKALPVGLQQFVALDGVRLSFSLKFTPDDQVNQKESGSVRNKHIGQMRVFKHLRTDWFRYGFETLAVVVGILAAFALENWN